MESPREYYKALCDGPPIELAPGLYQLTIPLPFRLNHVHVYLVEADKGFMLIDTGVNTSEAFSSLKRKLDDIGLDFHAITQVVITHFHSDHCGQAARIHDLGGAQIAMGDIERTTWESSQAGLDNQPEEQFLRHGLPPEQAKEHVDVLPYLKSLTTPFDIDLRARLPLSARREAHVFRRPYFTKNYPEHRLASLLWTRSIGGLPTIAAGDIGTWRYAVATLARADGRGSRNTHPCITSTSRSPPAELC